MKKLTFYLQIILIVFQARYCEASLKLNHGVRPIGMGGAFVSIADDGTTVWWNPAGLSYRDVAEFNISGGRIFGNVRGPAVLDIYANSIQPVGKFGVGAWHLSLLHVPFDQGIENSGDGYYEEGIFGLALGKSFRKQQPLSIGGSFNFVFKNISPNDYTAIDPLLADRKRLIKISFDAGILYQINEHFTLGASMRNLNEPNIAFDKNTKDKLPHAYQIGISYRNDFRYWTLRTALEYSDRNKAINQQRDQMYHIGLEGWFFRGMTGLRWGLNRDELSVGFSGRVNQQSMPIQLDVSYTVPITEMTNPGNIWRVALRFQFGREGGFAPEITIKQFEIYDLFAALYKYYASTTVGYVEIFNDTHAIYKNIKVGLLINRYMDFPTETNIERLTPYSKIKVPLFASLNNSILIVEEDTPVQARLTVTYSIANEQVEQSLAKTFTLFSRNAINWTDPAKIGTFITPKNTTIDRFVKQAIYPFIPENANSLYPSLSEAMQLFGIFSAYGIRYVIDPNNPYNGPSVGERAIDYIRYPTETLKLKSGDCDDLATLYCSALENLGISSAFIDIPGHVFAMFNLNLTMEEALDVGLPADLLLSWDDLKFSYNSLEDSTNFMDLVEAHNLHEMVWIPVETTLFGAGSFIEAWQIGVENFRKSRNKHRVIIIQEAWRKYTPATLDPVVWEPALPDQQEVNALLSTDKKRLLQERTGTKIMQLMNQVNNGNQPDDAFNSLGVIYCQGGLYEEGAQYFRDALVYNPDHSGAHNNLGNIFYQENKWDDAIAEYRAAAAADSSDAGIYVNIALAYYKKGDYIQAKVYLRKAIEIYPGYITLYETLWRDE